MRKGLTKLCNKGFKVLSHYKRLRDILANQGDRKEPLFQEMLNRIVIGQGFMMLMQTVGLLTAKQTLLETE